MLRALPASASGRCVSGEAISARRGLDSNLDSAQARKVLSSLSSCVSDRPESAYAHGLPFIFDTRSTRCFQPLDGIPKSQSERRARIPLIA